MPIPPIPDETPAWIKGDLPAESSEGDPVLATAPQAPADASQPDAESLVPTDEPAGLTPEPLIPEPVAPLEAEPEAAEASMPVETDTPEPALGQLAAAPGGLQPDVAVSAEAVEPAPDAAESASTAAAASEPLVLQPELAPAPDLATAEPAPPEIPVVEELSLEAQIESLLFVADGAVPIGRLAEALEVSSREVEAALAELAHNYRLRGLSLQRFRDKVQMTTSPSAAARVERFLGLAAATPLSRAALESLAIVAYQQPVTRPQIEAVRGVNSDSVIKNLLSKGLIEESGRAEGPGRPVLYATTPEFMQHFGLASLADLPPLSLPTSDAGLSPERILKG